MRVFYCPKHNVTVTITENIKHITGPPIGLNQMYGPDRNECALLTARHIEAGRLYRLDANGFLTNQYCDIEER